MKYVNFYALAAAAAIILSAGCSKESAKQGDPDSEELAFTAVNSDTRSCLSEGTKVLFQEGDAISLFSASNSNKKLTTSDGTVNGTATFIGSGKKGDDPYYAVYPYTAGTTLNGSKIEGFSVPTSQTAAEGTFAPEASITFAKATGTNLQFHNLCSILQAKMPEDLDNVQITVTGAAVSGSVDVGSLADGGALTPKSGNTNYTVTLSGATMKAGSVYYISIIPGTYSTLTLAGQKGGITKISLSRSSTFTFEKGRIYNLNTVFQVTGTNDDFDEGGDFVWD